MNTPLEEQLLRAWQCNQQILLDVLDNLPPGGAEAVPANSRGRTVAEQFAHLDKVRSGWVEYHRTGSRPKSERVKKGMPPPLAEIRSRLVQSGDAVAQHLAAALKGEARVRMFGGSPVRWICYLISHESHHRGSILIALKQNGLRMPDAIALEDVWGRWIDNK